MPSLSSVVVPRGKILFPNLCPVCLSANPTSVQTITSDYGKFSGYYAFFTTSKHLVTQVALCADCALKERRLQRYCQASIVIGLIFGLIVAVHLDFDRGTTCLVGIAFGAPGILVSEYVGKPVRVGKYDEKTVEFCFKCSEYADKFRAMNQV